MQDASEGHIHQAATVLQSALKGFTSAWPDFPSALAEARTFLQPDRLAFLALESANVIGWIGAVRHSDSLWELHPLVVDPNHQRKGVGRRLVEALEAEARNAGVSVIYLGTDDEAGATNIFGKNLCPNVLDHLRGLDSVAGHPYQFYQSIGYTVVGVIPDASGPGKPDILMAKKIS